MNEREFARDALLRNVGVFEGAYLDRKESARALSEIKAATREISELRGAAHVLQSRVKRYFKDEARNKREIKRFLKKSRKRLLRKEKGKYAKYDIPRALITDLRQSRWELAALIRGMAEKIAL